MERRNVLVMEDDAVIGMCLATMLSDMGFEVGEVQSTAVEAVQAAGRRRPDLMIVDVHLAGGHGISAVQDILRGGFIPHIFISGDRLDQATLGEDAIVLQKPFFESELTRAIDRAFAAPPRP